MGSQKGGASSYLKTRFRVKNIILEGEFYLS